MRFWQEHFGKWGLALAGKARGEDAGGWFDTEVGADADPKSISHEHTYNEDTADPEQIESTLMRLSEMVGRRLREKHLHARTIQLKLRYKDFTTITRAHSLTAPTQLDTEIFEQARALFRKNWRKGAQVRLLGVHAVVVRQGIATGRSAGRRPASALAASPLGRGSPARQVRRVERVPGHRFERRLPRAYPREPGRLARAKANSSASGQAANDLRFYAFGVRFRRRRLIKTLELQCFLYRLVFAATNPQQDPFKLRLI